MRISDWSSVVCSSDLLDKIYSQMPLTLAMCEVAWSSSKDFLLVSIPMFILLGEILLRAGVAERMYDAMVKWLSWIPGGLMHSNIGACAIFAARSEEHTSELQSLMRISYAVFCLTKKKSKIVDIIKRQQEDRCRQYRHTNYILKLS